MLFYPLLLVHLERRDLQGSAAPPGSLSERSKEHEASGMSQKIQGQGGSATLHPPIFGHSPDLVMQPKPPSPWRIAKGSGWSFLECPFISCSRTKTINQLVYLHFYPTTLTNKSSASVCTIFILFLFIFIIRMPICVPCSWGLEPQLTGRRGNPILIFLR